MKTFEMNGLLWQVIDVPEDSPFLIDRTGRRTVATTDGKTLCVYVSDSVSGDFRKRVIAHEMGHATCFSYGLLDEIRRCCYPSKRIEMEEFICNFVADHGEMIFEITYSLLGDDALRMLPKYLERLVA